MSTGKQILLIAAAVGFAGLTLLAVWHWVLVVHRSGPEHTFVLDAKPAFLSNALALEKARATLSLDGYDNSLWEPEVQNCTKAPDGSVDVHLLRSDSSNPNTGIIEFRQVDESAQGRVVQRIVRLELRENRVVCQVIRPL